MADRDGWVKIHRSILDDALSPSQFKFLVSSVLLADSMQAKEPGRVDLSIRQLSDLLCMCRSEVDRRLHEFAEKGTLTIQTRGFTILNYEKYQGRSVPPAGQSTHERIEAIPESVPPAGQHERGVRKCPAHGTGKGAGVPPTGQSVPPAGHFVPSHTAGNEDKNKNIKNKNGSSSDNNNNSTSEIFNLYEQEIGMLTPTTADGIRDWLDQYPEEHIREAIKEAVLQNVRKPKYISAILESWRTNGYRKNGRGAQNKNDDAVQHILDGVEDE